MNIQKKVNIHFCSKNEYSEKNEYSLLPKNEYSLKSEYSLFEAD